MHPDRRRAGRAIRKQRRLEREPYFARKDRELEYVTSGQFARDMEQLVKAVAEGFTAMSRSFEMVGKALGTSLGTIKAGNQCALAPVPGAARRSEAGSLYPTLKGVQRAREAHSVSPRPNGDQR